MAGLGLIQAGFLAATVAVAVPILIHLLMRPQARAGDDRFDPVSAVGAAAQHAAPEHSPLAAAGPADAGGVGVGPAVRPSLLGRSGRAGRDRQVLVLLDRSASMWAAESGRTLFAAAKQAALGHHRQAAGRDGGTAGLLR